MTTQQALPLEVTPPAPSPAMTFEQLDPAAPVVYATMPSPVGELLMVGDGARLSGVYFPLGPGRDPVIGADWRHAPALFEPVVTQLGAYFAGELRKFDLRLAPRGTAFQRRVWQELTTIGYGRTASYGAIAAALGMPSASRAVGLANGRNPIPVIVPCHRVIGANGSLTGYAGGLARKELLLRLERGRQPVR